MTRGGNGPTPAAERIELMDVTRGIAVLGILLMNIVGFAYPFPAFMNPTVMGGAEGANFWAWFLPMVFVEGTMRGLFSLLFGAGFILMLARLEAKGLGLRGAEIYTRRLVWLAVFGLIHSYLLLWFGDILFAYGAMGLLLLAFRPLPARWLAVAGLVLILAGTVKTELTRVAEVHQAHERAALAEAAHDAGEILGEAQQQDIDNWQRRQAGPSAALVQSRLDAFRGGYAAAFGLLSRITPAIEMDGIYGSGLFETLSMFLLGAALMKAGFWRQGPTGPTGPSGRTLWLVMIAAYAVGIGGRWYYLGAYAAGGYHILDQVDYDRVNLILRLAVSVGHLALITLAWRAVAGAGLFRRTRVGLAAVGRMALSNYIAQTILAGLFFNGYGLGYYGYLERLEIYYVVAAIWALNIAFSLLWLRAYRMGPLEWLWRALTYLERPALRRAAPGPATRS